MWKNIWNKKGLDSANVEIAELMRCDGFDTSDDSLSTESWIEFFKYVAKMAQIDSGKKQILEIGCGSGAALKVLESINSDLEIFGIDYSKSLIEVAKCAIKNGKFICDEAVNLDSAFADYVPKKSVKIGGGGDLNFIFSNSAFHYFPNKEYVFNVIKKSYNLLTHGGNLALLDLNDIKTKGIYCKIRKGTMSEQEYNEKYAGLEHLFFDKREMFEFIESLGFEKIIVEKQHINGYINNKCRFNVFALEKL